MFGLESRYGNSTQIHEGLWLDQQRIGLTDRDLCSERLQLWSAHFAAGTPCEFIDEDESTIVTGPLIFWTGVSQPDDQPHAKTLLFRLTLLDHFRLSRSVTGRLGRRTR